MITDRLLKIIENETDAKNRFKKLDEATDIAKDSWTAVWHRRQRPTAEMIEAIAKLWPDYAYWLATGDTEPEFGHIAPSNIESEWPIENAPPQKWASEERKLKQQMLKQVPESEQEKELQKKIVRDQVFELRSKLLLPGTYICFKEIGKVLQSEMKDDLFLLEYDAEMRKVRIERYEETKTITDAVSKHRKNLSTTLTLESGLETGINSAKSLFDNILNLLKFSKK